LESFPPQKLIQVLRHGIYRSLNLESVELESFPPQKLIQVLRHGISGSLNLESDDSSIILIGDSGINSGNDIYMVESFG
jgi:hypothetical protein